MTEADIDKWVAKQGLPPRAGRLFRFPFSGFGNPDFRNFRKAYAIVRELDTYHVVEGGHLEIINQFIAAKNHCVAPLHKICELLETEEQMMIFSFCLHRAWMIWGDGKEDDAHERGTSALAIGCSRSEKADEYREQISQKTQEIVELVNKLAILGDARWVGSSQTSVYSALLQGAVDIQSNSLPDPISKWADWVAYDTSDGVLAQKFQAFIDDVGAHYDTEFPLPMMESLILAYGQQVVDGFGNNSTYRDSVETKRKKSVGDNWNAAFFVRGFAGILIRLVEVGVLPEKIRTLSPATFDKLFNHPFPGINSTSYIWANWTPKKDSTADKFAQEQKKINAKKER